MKRLMMATAIALVGAFAATADVASANIVGYGEAATAPNGGIRLVGASFKNLMTVEGKQGIYLSTLKISGCENNYFKSLEMPGVWGQFTITVLNENGGTAKFDDGCEKFFTYHHHWDGEAWEDDGFWYHEEYGIIGGENPDIFLPIGEALWLEITPDAFAKGEKYGLQSSGEAVIEAQQIPFQPGVKGIAIPCSYDVKLSDITITGYKDVAFFKNREELVGVWGDFTLTILDQNGGTMKDAEHDNTEMYYSYHHHFDGEEWETEDGFWYQEDLGIAGDDEDAGFNVTFKMGTAFWAVITPDAYTEKEGKTGEYNETYSLVFPGMDE